MSVSVLELTLSFILGLVSLGLPDLYGYRFYVGPQAVAVAHEVKSWSWWLSLKKIVIHLIKCPCKRSIVGPMLHPPSRKECLQKNMAMGLVKEVEHPKLTEKVCHSLTWSYLRVTLLFSFNVTLTLWIGLGHVCRCTS